MEYLEMVLIIFNNLNFIGENEILKSKGYIEIINQ